MKPYPSVFHASSTNKLRRVIGCYTANPPTNIVDFRGFDSNIRNLTWRGGILVHREFPGKTESSNTSGNNVSREIGRNRCSERRHAPPLNNNNNNNNDNNNYYCLPCECSQGSKHINAIDMQSRPAVFMSARLVVASCAEMAAEADIGHYMQHTINTPPLPRYTGGSRERE